MEDTESTAADNGDESVEYDYGKDKDKKQSNLGERILVVDKGAEPRKEAKVCPTSSFAGNYRYVIVLRDVERKYQRQQPAC